MLRRLFVRAALTFVLLITGLGVTLGVTATSASAASTDCLVSWPADFKYYYNNGDTADGFKGVSRSDDLYLSPTTATSACKAPYEGYNSTCITVRLVIYYRPGVGYMTTYGPWVRSCWTPQLLASGWGGWLHRGDYVYLEARAEQDGGHHPTGELVG